MRVCGSRRTLGLALGLIAACVTLGWSETDIDLAKAVQAGYSRVTSPVMVRMIDARDRASLDLAAYDRNRLFHYPLSISLQPPTALPALADLTFTGTLVQGSVVDGIDQTPLTTDERAHPLAWRPLVDYLSAWDYERARPLMALTTAVSGEKWGNGEAVRPLQQIVTAYLHGDELWAKVEFRPELTWLPVTDEDGDGYPELYGRIAPSSFDASVLKRIRDDYMGNPLSDEELHDYFFELSSKWYQAMQTITLQPDETHPWPNSATEPAIVQALGAKSFAEPFAVIRGQPFGEPIYNVFVLTNAEPTDPWQAELKRFGGSWDAWRAILAAFRADVQRQLDARPKELRGLIGPDETLFFRGDLDYLLSGDLRSQPDGRDPFPAIVDFNNQLKARGIDLLLVVIPSKAEVYPEKLSTLAPAGAVPYVAPDCRKLLAELSEAGVAMVDLLPTFVKQRAPAPDLLYMPSDTHWTNRGARLAAKLIAERVRKYSWYSTAAVQRVKYTGKDVSFKRTGDITAMLSDQERLQYPPMQLTARQVLLPGGTLYDDDPTSPIVMLGDSFTGVFQFEDCKHAGLSAQLALELGTPIDLMMAQGSGPRIRASLARRGAEAIASKKLVIWTVAARDLYKYWAPWEKVALP